MKMIINRYALMLLAAVVLIITGCGGGGGGGGLLPAADIPDIPADSAFEVPATFDSKAFPKQGPTVNLTIDNFTAASVGYLYLMNFSDGSLAPSWTVSGPAFGASRKAMIAGSSDSRPISAEHKFLFELREKARSMPVPSVVDADAKQRASIRAAIAVGDTANFMAYIKNFVQPQLIAATCELSELIPTTGKKVHFFVDNQDRGMANLGNVLQQLRDKWLTANTGIYFKNRQVFGDEPSGLLSSNVDATDFYILFSRRIYTAGYFYTGDLSAVGQVADSNMKKMFYLQLPSSITVAAGLNSISTTVRELSATMAHEFQHMIHYFQRGSFSNTWLEEAMSGYAEYINGYRIENGLNQSKALQANKYFELISSSVSFNEWHAKNDVDAVVNAYYGKAYLFGVWLAQNFGSNDSVKSLLTQRVGDEQAIEAFTGKSFEEIFSKFMIALSINDTNGGTYGFAGLDLKGTYSFGAGLGDVTLTGPYTIEADATDGLTGNPDLPSYSAAYVKIAGGDGSDVSISANLPQYSALFQIHR
jgi:hypothetical protein